MDDPLAPLKPGDRIGKALNVARLNTLAQLAQDAMAGKFLRGGPGTLIKSGVSGTTVASRKPLRTGGRRVLPLECRVRNDAGTLKVKVEASTILGTMPTIGGTSLAAATPPEMTLSASGTYHVVATMTLSMSVSDGFVFPVIVVSSVTLALTSSEPTAADLVGTTGTFKALLATYVDGVKTAQNGYGPISGELCDTLTGEGKASLVLTWGDYQS